jgi:menaquinone-9 beta-reductase
VLVPEDTGQIIINSTMGELATVFPQGPGRARAYNCYQRGTRARYRTTDRARYRTTDLARFIEDRKATGVNPAWLDRARQAGPLATFEGADAWVEHPYQEGVALIGDPRPRPIPLGGRAWR